MSKKKNMGTVRDLIKAAPEGSKISDGIREYSKEEALKAASLADLLDLPVHSVDNGTLYVEKSFSVGIGAFKSLTRPIKVMAAHIGR